MALGLVGGAHQTRPLAHIALKILGVKGAQELAEAAVTVGPGTEHGGDPGAGQLILNECAKRMHWLQVGLRFACPRLVINCTPGP
ncbi:hypothetical protein [Mesorhizobium sp. M0870]|uniref:hypothetical protein n=1 Tax=Mesorhizobium sp. M0870 TaxID=2957016 RepID=UPI0033394006